MRGDPKVAVSLRETHIADYESKFYGLSGQEIQGDVNKPGTVVIFRKFLKWVRLVGWEGMIFAIC